MSEHPNVCVIDLWLPTAQCCICGQWDISKWGVPVSMETAQVVSNESTEDWGAKPACKECWTKHEQGEFVGTYPKF